MLTFCGGGIEWDSNDEMLSMAYPNVYRIGKLAATREGERDMR
jgi:hypothetical protein